MFNNPIKRQVLVTGKAVSAEVLKDNSKTFWVKLPDGNVIKRHKNKHTVTL